MNLNILSQLKLKNKIIALAVLFPLTIVCLIYFIISPTIKDIRTMSDDIEAQRIDLEVKYAKGQSLRKLSENLKIIEPQLSDLDKIFINNDKVLGFITSFEDIAYNNNVSQKINLASDIGVPDNGYFKKPLQVSSSGNFNNQLNYLLNLESSSYYINISSLDFSAISSRVVTPDEAPQKIINLLIFADTYWK